MNLNMPIIQRELGYGGLPGRHAAGARLVNVAVLAALLFVLEAREAEVLRASSAHQEFAPGSVVLQQEATGGTRPEGGAAGDPVHIEEGHVRTVFQGLQGLVDAAFVTTAICPWRRASPLSQALPAEEENCTVVSAAHRALHTEAVEVAPQHCGLAPGT